MNTTQQIIDHIRSTTPKSATNVRRSLPDNGCAAIAAVIVLAVVVVATALLGPLFL